MRTVIIVIAGFVLLALVLAVTSRKRNATQTKRAVTYFAVLWFIIAAVNMWIGVAQAGYSFLDELPIFLIIFLLPSLAGFFYVRRKLSKESNPL